MTPERLAEIRAHNDKCADLIGKLASGHERWRIAERERAEKAEAALDNPGFTLEKLSEFELRQLGLQRVKK